VVGVIVTPLAGDFLSNQQQADIDGSNSNDFYAEI
jgi:hypothetical protein